MFLVSICRRGIVGVTVELRHLRYFVAVAEAENVLRAATQKLHVSQPAVSRQIRDLEDELGVQLFQRTGKAVSLTDAGRVFLREARAVLERTDEAVKNVRAFAQTGETELHVGYSPQPGAQILPVVLRAFQQAMPDVHVRLHDWSYEQIAVALETFGYTFGNRVKLVRLTPEPKPISFGIAARKGRLSPATEKFWQCAKEAAASNRSLSEKVASR